MKLVAVDMTDSMDESVVHTVAHSRLLVEFTVHFKFHGCHWLETIRSADHIAAKTNLIVWRTVLQHIVHDEWQVLLRDELLLVAQFYDSVCHSARLLRREFQSEFLQILQDVRLATVLTQRIFALSAEAFRQEGIAIEVLLGIAIGMNTSHLREHALTHDGFVWRHSNTTETLHQLGCCIEFLLVDGSLYAEMVLQHGLHTRNRCVACTFAQTIHTGVDSGTTRHHSAHHVGNCQVVVVVSMIVETQRWEPFLHLCHEARYLHRCEDAERVGQHESLNV